MIERATLVQSARPGTPSPQRAIWTLLPLAEQAAVFYLLAIAAGVHGFVDVMFYAKSSDVVTEGESLLSSLVWPLAYVLFAALIVLRSQTVQRAFLSAPWVALYAGCAALSVMWSVDPLITANGAVRLAMTTLIGLYIGSASRRRRYSGCCSGSSSGILVSILLDLAGLDFARMLNGATRGSSITRMSWAAAPCCYWRSALPSVGGIGPLLAIAGLVVALAALVMAHSGTSLVAAAAVVAATFCLMLRGTWLRVAFRCALGVTLVVLLAGVLTWWQVNPVLAALDLLGKDKGLTGRTLLWGAGWAQFWERPLLGIGFDGFWHAAIDTRTFLVLNIMGTVSITFTTRTSTSPCSSELGPVRRGRHPDLLVLDRRCLSGPDAWPGWRGTTPLHHGKPRHQPRRAEPFREARSFDDPARRPSSGNEPAAEPAADNLQPPAAGPGHGLRGGLAAIGAVGEDHLDEREQPPRRAQQRDGAVAVLDVGRLDHGAQQQAQRVDQDVALLALDLLARVETRRVDARPPLWMARPSPRCSAVGWRIGSGEEGADPCRSRFLARSR